MSGSPGRHGGGPAGRQGGRGRVRPPRGGILVRPGSQFLPQGAGRGDPLPLPTGGVVRRVLPNGGAPVAGVEQHKKHFVDSMLLEADRTVNRFRSLVNEIRRSWFSAQRDDKTVTLATRKIREAIVAARASLETTDMKVIDIYRSNVEEADMRDIEPGSSGEELRLAQEEQIFAKSELVDQNGIVESLETTPDLPFRKVADRFEEHLRLSPGLITGNPAPNFCGHFFISILKKLTNLAEFGLFVSISSIVIGNLVQLRVH